MGRVTYAGRVRPVSIATCDERRSLMKSKLLIVADLGRVKAYKLDYTLYNTPRLEQLEEIALEEAHNRLLDKVTDEAVMAPPPKRTGARHWPTITICSSSSNGGSSARFPTTSSGSSSAAVVTSAGWLHRRRSTRRFLKNFLRLSASVSRRIFRAT
jgi:hypothetical protein